MKTKPMYSKNTWVAVKSPVTTNDVLSLNIIVCDENDNPIMIRAPRFNGDHEAADSFIKSNLSKGRKLYPIIYIPYRHRKYYIPVVFRLDSENFLLVDMRNVHCFEEMDK